MFGAVSVSVENPDMRRPRRYEAKEVTFHLKEPGHGGQKERTYASVTLDVANFAPQEGPTSSPSEFKVVLFQGTREIQTHLHLTIQSQWLTVRFASQDAVFERMTSELAA